MKVFIERSSKTTEMKFSGTAVQLVKKLKLNPEEVLVVKNDVLVTEEEKISDNDNVKVLSVISGG